MEIGQIQERWLKALESGDYKQGKGQLCSSDKAERCYCCLGIGAIILGREFEEAEDSNNIEVDGCNEFLIQFENLGLIESDGRLSEHAIVMDEDNDSEYVESLTDLNDRGYSFKYIANYIRNNPEKVFNKAV